MMNTAATGQAISIVDLDTVKPGLVHYDIGDCLRSGLPIFWAKKPSDGRRFALNPILVGPFCKAISGKDFLTKNDYEYLYDAIRLIAFELGLRFFTDYLEGNVYFRYQEHNLPGRSFNSSLPSIESQAAAIRM